VTWRILLCSDGSPASATGAAMLQALRLVADADLTVLGVLEPSHEAGQLEVALRDLSGRLEMAGGNPQVLLRRGHAAEEILAAAEASAYDLVVVGAQGARGLTRFRIGSTASRLARHLRTSLLACRQPRRPSTAFCSASAGRSLRSTRFERARLSRARLAPPSP
jgi:nucleotide-binding universal stress UspA family protein